MSYSKMMRESIQKSNLSLSKICEMLKPFGFKTNKAYLSNLQNGKLPPGSNSLNEALAQVLGIDPVDLKLAAYQEKIPKDVLKKLTKQTKHTS